MDNIFADLYNGFDQRGLTGSYRLLDVMLDSYTDIPLWPATSILNLPSLFPLVENGRRLGILILGIISSG